MPTEKATNGRKANGQFDKGWKGGPGNPLWKHNQELKEALEYCCDTKTMRAIGDVLVKKAKGGDLEAMRLLFDRILGKVKEATDGDVHDHFPILVTTTAEALKQLEARRSLGDDPLRGLRRLSDGDDPPVPPTIDVKG